MSEAWKCMSGYQKLTDGVLDYIMMSNEKGLEKSKNLLSRIYNRDLYKCVYESSPTKVFISICYYKIDEREMPTMLILLLRNSWRNTSFSFCPLSRFSDSLSRFVSLLSLFSLPVSWTFIIHYYEYYSVLYYNAVFPVICEGWHFTDIWKSLAWQHHFTNEGRFGSIALI